MKLLSAIFSTSCLLINLVFAQVPPPSAAANRTSWQTLNEKYNNPKIVLDDKFIADSSRKHVLDKLDPYAVMKISILHQTAPKRNVVYITTDNVRIAEYQKKLSAFSKEYKEYLATHQHIDSHLMYFLNSVMLSGDHTDVIDELYNIPVNKITGVRFGISNPADSTLKYVSINTKE